MFDILQLVPARVSIVRLNVVRFFGPDTQKTRQNWSKASQNFGTSYNFGLNFWSGPFSEPLHKPLPKLINLMRLCQLDALFRAKIKIGFTFDPEVYYVKKLITAGYRLKIVLSTIMATAFTRASDSFASKSSHAEFLASYR